MKMEKNLKKRSVEKFVGKIVRCAFEEIAQVLENNPNGISLLKVNNRNRKMFLLLTLNMQLPAGKVLYSSISVNFPKVLQQLFF